jgi:hypothetical protein
MGAMLVSAKAIAKITKARPIKFRNEWTRNSPCPAPRAFDVIKTPSGHKGCAAKIRGGTEPFLASKLAAGSKRLMSRTSAKQPGKATMKRATSAKYG